MTLDKFGRHIVKHGKSSDYDDSDTIDVSKFMSYNIILKFDSDKYLNGFFLLTFNKTHYSFPLKFGVIEKVIFSTVDEENDILLSINNNIILTQDLLNFPLRENDQIAFLLHPHKTQESTLNCFSAELVIKCPVNFDSLVQSERANHTQ